MKRDGSGPIWQVFDGPRWRRTAIEALRSSLPRDPPPVWVVLLTSQKNRRFEVARISAHEKLRAFQAAGVPAQLITVSNWRQVATSRESLILSDTLKVMQHPLPQEIANLPVRNDLDFNPGRDWAWPAVCEATKRALIALGGWRVEEPVAVVGAKGFIGKHLVSMLEAGGCRPVALDKDDSLSALSKVNLVVAAASAAGFLTVRHIRSTHTVLDLGFEKTKSGTAIGNLTTAAFQKANYATPVPGGMGPAQIAILLERYFVMVVGAWPTSNGTGSN